MSAPYGFRFPGRKGICIIVLRGTCYLGVDDEPTLPLSGGDFVLLPSPEFYTLRSDPKCALRPIEELISEAEFHRSRLIEFDGGEGPGTSIVAGCFTFESPESQLLVRHLPAVVHLQAAGDNVPAWFQTTLHFIAAETSKNLPGSTAIVDRLAEVLFIQAMRSRMDMTQPVGDPSWLRALADPQIGNALRQMHADPARQWTVADLARGVSMSRSAFADRFKELVGDTPLGHLTRWRMVKAAHMMLLTKAPNLIEVASSIGYDSESSFGKAFRRVMGTSPGKYRQEKRFKSSPDRH